MKNLQQTIIAHWPVLLLIVYCLTMALIPYSPILGEYEARTVFFAFAPEHYWINTLIQPRGCVGAYEYAALDLSRYVARLFGFNLFSIRILPVMYGLLSLFFMYRILKYWYGRNPAVLGTALLATNQVFLFFQHQLIIPIVSFVGLMFCIDRFIKIDGVQATRTSAFMFGLACALTAINYHIGRYCMLAIFLFWLTDGIVFGKGFRFDLEQNWLVNKEKRGNVLAAVAGFLGTLIALNPMNLFIFFSKKFLVPEEGLVNEFAQTFSQVILFMKDGFPKLLHSFLGTSNYYGPYSSDLLVSIPYQLITPVLLILVLVGLCSLFGRNAVKRRSLFILMMLFVTTVPLTLSLPLEDGRSSLNPYRLFFALIPLYFLTGGGLHWIFQKVKSTGTPVKTFVIFAVCALVGVQCYAYLQEKERFEEYLNSWHCDFGSSSHPHPKYRNQREYYCRPAREFSDHWQSSGRYVDTKSPNESELKEYAFALLHWHYAKRLSQKVKAQSLSEDTALLLDVPTSEIDPLNSASRFVWSNYNPFFFSFYMKENGVDVNYVVPYPGEAPISRWTHFRHFLYTRLLNFKSAVSHRSSKLLRFPVYCGLIEGKYDVKWLDRGSFLPVWMIVVNDLWDEESPRKICRIFQRVAKFIGIKPPGEFGKDYKITSHFTLRSTGMRESRIYIITTESEREYVLELLKKEGRKHQTLRL